MLYQENVGTRKLSSHYFLKILSLFIAMCLKLVMISEKTGYIIRGINVSG